MVVLIDLTSNMTPFPMPLRPEGRGGLQECTDAGDAGIHLGVS